MLTARLQLTLPEWLDGVVSDATAFPDDASRMALAIELARRNVENATGGPFGAAVFSGDGRLISVGVNRVIAHTCSIAHAEIMAYALAQARLQRYRLNETGDKFVLATSAQPCCQCYGATIWAGIDELLIGARSELRGRLCDEPGDGREVVFGKVRKQALHLLPVGFFERELLFK